MSNILNQTFLNQYRVDDFIASGGMGAVYRVWDLKRNVYLAMKVLHSELAEDPSVYKRFQREARALKKLSHPNIVPFYGLHKVGDIAFLLEHYIDGPTLKDILRNLGGNKLSMENVSILLKPLTAALGYAHEHGVVHCDVKPGNVMMDWGGTVYLTDFGIARHAESTVTTIGFAGTAHYMAPEQCRGEPVSPATDIYALGVLLFEMLTGQRPFHGDESETEEVGYSTAERIRHAHLHVPAPNPSDLNPDLSKNLASVIFRALEKEPQDRYQSIQEFFQAFCAALDFNPGEIKNRVSIPKGLFPKREVVPREGDISTPTTAKQLIPHTPSLQKMHWTWIAGIAVVIVMFILIRTLSSRQKDSIFSVDASATADFLEGVNSTNTASAANEARATTSAAETVVAQFTEEFIATQVAVRLSWTPTPTPTSKPSFTDIYFCDKPCDEPGAKIIHSAPERSTEIFLTWSYERICDMGFVTLGSGLCMERNGYTTNVFGGALKVAHLILDSMI